MSATLVERRIGRVGPGDDHAMGRKLGGVDPVAATPMRPRQDRHMLIGLLLVVLGRLSRNSAPSARNTAPP